MYTENFTYLVKIIYWMTQNMITLLFIEYILREKEL